MTYVSSLSHYDQDKVIQSVYKDDQKRFIDKNEAKKISAMKKNDPNITIEDCIKNILK